MPPEIIEAINRANLDIRMTFQVPVLIRLPEREYHQVVRHGRDAPCIRATLADPAKPDAEPSCSYLGIPLDMTSGEPHILTDRGGMVSLLTGSRCAK